MLLAKIIPLRFNIPQKFILGCTIALLLLMMYIPPKAVEPQEATRKKMIELGWDIPTPSFFRQHIKEMEQRPFDGVIIKLSVGQQVFKKTAYPNTAFTQDQKDLAATKSSRLTDNFVNMWSGMEEGWDWFNDADWANASKNIQNFAKTAKAGRFRGVAFDPEPYSHGPWKYNDQFQQKNKTFQEYQVQVRKRGAQFMKLLQSTQPDTQVLTLGLLSWMKALVVEPIDPPILQQQLAQHDYGLWPAFINGMLDTTEPSSTIIDGNEGAYYFYRAAWFEGMHNLIRKDTRVFVDRINYQKYDKQVKLGQSVYVDLVLDLFKKPANNINNGWFGMTMQHFLSPDDRLRLLEHNIYHSLRTTDRYAWIYSENLNWWQKNIPKGAEEAIRRAKTKIQTGKPLGFDVDSVTEVALKKCKAINPKC